MRPDSGQKRVTHHQTMASEGRGKEGGREGGRERGGEREGGGRGGGGGGREGGGEGGEWMSDIGVDSMRDRVM